MRKGSKKVVIPGELTEKGEVIEKYADIVGYKIPDISIKHILLRICDACHDIDGRIEPWAGIRHDIERLK
jgi:hypothetical protein